MAWKKKDSIYADLQTYIPRSLVETLTKISKDRGVPISKLLNYAIDNELDTERPFNYLTELPKIQFSEGYSVNSVKVWQFMKKEFKKGVGLDTLLIFRRDIGIENRQDVLQAVAELLHSRYIKQIKTTNRAYKSEYPFYTFVPFTDEIKL